MRAVLHRDRVRVRIVRYDRKRPSRGPRARHPRAPQGADHRPPAARGRHLAGRARRQALRPGHPDPQERHRQRDSRARWWRSS
ncbi:MAG: hypothetical protein MZW92_33965 [Comamonadaceae bacterium]|nr:hypothetical protein [Comamonadaceae bacterium]